MIWGFGQSNISEKVFFFLKLQKTVLFLNNNHFNNFWSEYIFCESSPLFDAIHSRPRLLFFLTAGTNEMRKFSEEKAFSRPFNNIRLFWILLGRYLMLTFRLSDRSFVKHAFSKTLFTMITLCEPFASFSVFIYTIRRMGWMEFSHNASMRNV